MGEHDGSAYQEGRRVDYVVVSQFNRRDAICNMHRVINEDEFRGVTLTRFSPSQLTPRKGMTHSQWQPSGVMNFVPPFAQINVSQSMATSAASTVQHLQIICFAKQFT